MGGRGGAAFGGFPLSLSLVSVLVDWLQLTHPSPFRTQGACSAVWGSVSSTPSVKPDRKPDNGRLSARQRHAPLVTFPQQFLRRPCSGWCSVVISKCLALPVNEWTIHCLSLVFGKLFHHGHPVCWDPFSIFLRISRRPLTSFGSHSYGQANSKDNGLPSLLFRLPVTMGRHF